MSNKIIIDPDKIPEFTKDGSHLVWKPEAEQAILKIFEIRDKCNKALELIEKAIETAGMSLGENFMGVKGEKIRAIRRAYGEKYSYDRLNFEKAKPFLKEIKFLKPDIDKITEYLEKYKKAPEGIVINERKKITKLYLKNAKKQVEGELLIA